MGCDQSRSDVGSPFHTHWLTLSHDPAQPRAGEQGSTRGVPEVSPETWRSNWDTDQNWTWWLQSKMAAKESSRKGPLSALETVGQDGTG